VIKKAKGRPLTFRRAPLARQRTQTRIDSLRGQPQRFIGIRHPRCSSVKFANRHAKLEKTATVTVSPGNQNHTVTSNPSSAAVRRNGKSGQGEMVRHLCEIGDFVRRLRVQVRFGELSRAPLRLLRLELRGGIAECEWIARPADRWDEELPSGTGERHASMQALQDALTVRDLLFRTLPDLGSAEIRVYRQAANDIPELVITGVVTRQQGALKAVRSMAMRAKLLGLRFWLEEGVLENLQQEEHAVNPQPRNDRLPV
jgi:hypothetical protein